MKKSLFIFYILALFALGETSLAQDVPEMNFEALKPYLKQNTDTVYVINFWATWCKPCVEELPYFMKAADEFKDKKVKFLFVSLDFAKNKESQLIPFIQKHKIKEQVILLNDPNSNYWINEINKDWSGAIPATIVYIKKDYTFKEGSLTYEELIQIIKDKTGMARAN